MPRNRLVLLASFLVPLGCRPGGTLEFPDDPAAPAAASPEASVAVAPPPEEAPEAPAPIDLGPADPEPEPLIPVEHPEYELAWTGPRILFGRRGSGGRLSSASAGNQRLLVAIDSPYQLFARSSTYVHVAAWRPKGQPAVGARVFVGNKEVGRTDGTGTLVFRYESKQREDDDGYSYGYGTSQITVLEGSRCGQAEFEPYARTPSFASDHLFVYADRAVFRPGDTIHLRTIGWRLTDDYKPLKKAEVEFALRDEDGHTIAGGTRKTTDFGTADLDLAIPGTTREGLHTLMVSYGEERATTRLQVRHFDPPAIRIDHTLGRFLTRDVDTMPFDVELRDATGRAIEKGEIEVVLQAGEEEVATLRKKVAGTGPHRIVLDNKHLDAAREKLLEGQYLIVKLEVRDGLGRTETLQRELRFTTNPWVAVLELDKAQYATGDPVVVNARITDLDRVPLRNEKVQLQIGTRKKKLSLSTSKAGIASFTLKMPSQQADVKLFIDGVDAPVATTSLPWVPSRAMRSELADPVIQEKKTARLAVRFPSGYIPADDHVHVDVVDTSGAIIQATLLRVKKEKGEYVARGEFEGPAWGSMLLTMFALGQEKDQDIRGAGEVALLTEGQNLVATPDRELQITLKAPSRVKPGAKVKLQAEVRDARGSLTEADVGIAMVDAGVVALKDPLEITPMDEFYNPELRTLSTTGSQILTWPVVTRNWGDHRMDVALPPFPAMPGGEIERCRGASGGRGVKKKKMAKSSTKGGIPGGVAGGVVGGVLGGAVGGSVSKKSAPMAMKADKAMDPPPPPPEPSAAPAKEMKQLESTVAADGNAVRGRGAPSADPAPPATITIRTRFEETALWSPHVAAKAGRAAVDTRVPDQIGAQEVLVVASDRRGGVGVARKKIQVAQPVHLAADLPARMVLGESLEIPVVLTNTTDEGGDFTLTSGGNKAKLTVAAGGQAGTSLSLDAKKLGRRKVRFDASGAGAGDAVQRSVDVRGRGVPLESRQTATLGGKRSTTMAFELPSQANDAHLEIAFPAFTSAFVGLDQLADDVADDPSRLAVDLATASLILHFAKSRHLDTADLDVLRERVLAVLAMVRVVQNDDGSFAWWRNGKPSPYVTAWVLEGLLEARRTGLPAPPQSIMLAADYLAGQVDATKPVAVDDIGWWEGTDETVRRGVTAEIFDVLAQVPKDLASARVRKNVKALALEHRAYLNGSDVDPLTGARALSGLLWARAVDEKDARAYARNLLSTRDERHWEPSWFHGYAGRIDATAVAIEVLHRAAPNDFMDEKRDALRWLLATREGWGEWHVERGTAAAVRTLLSLGAVGEEIASTVVVKLDGREVQRVAVDPADPLGSTRALARLDLGERLAAGKHVLEIEYDGALDPTARLVTRTWTPGNSATTKGGGATLAAAGKDTVGLDQTTWVRISVGAKERGSMRLLLSASGLFELDRAKMARFVGPRRAVTSMRVTEDGIELGLSSRKKAMEVSVPLRAVRRGTGHLPSVALKRSGGSTLVVDPGPVTVK